MQIHSKVQRETVMLEQNDRVHENVWPFRAPHCHDRSHLPLWALFSPSLPPHRLEPFLPAIPAQGRDDTALRERLRHWAALKPRWGAPILHDVLQAEGLVINHKRTGRI